MSKAQKIPSTTFSYLLHFLKPQWIGFLIILITGTMWGFNEILFPYFLKLIINKVSAYQGDVSAIYSVIKWPLYGLMGFWIILEVSMRLQGWMGYRHFPKFKANIRKQVFKYIKDHSYEYFSNNFSGNIANKLSTLPESTELLLEIIMFVFTPTSIMVLTTAILVCQTSFLFALVLFSWLTIHYTITCFFIKKINSSTEAHAESQSNLTGILVDSLTNIFNIRIFARGFYEDNYFAHHQEEEIKKNRSARAAIEKMKILQGSLAICFIFTIIFLLIHGWQAGWVTIGDFTFISMSCFMVAGMTLWTAYQLTLFTREIGKVNAALNLIAIGHGVKDIPHAKTLTISKADIVFDKVTFAYRHNRPVFDELSLTIPAGQKVGLVGYSGSGKSTFVNILLRFYDIQSGKILIDGQNIAEVTQDSLRDGISMIPQDPTLFHRTLMENIRYGRLDATDEEVFQAAQLAHCSDFINKLDNGYQTPVGERGTKLSGGQRQRIAIARAILKNAPILILDEATSSLDSITEKLIQDSLDFLMKNKTTIIIAHRLSTLSTVDRILVFENGKIIQDGPLKKLLKEKGHFKDLWSMQVDGFIADGERVIE